MRLTHLFVSFLVAVSMVAACGGDGGTETKVDAPKPIDAAPDAPPAPLTGIGQRCGMGGTACTAAAPICLVTAQNGPGICTKECIASSTFMTNAMGVPDAFNPAPETQSAMCASAYTGTVGTGACSIPYNLMPAHAMLMPNTTYTVKFGCGINCGAGNTCPTGLTCNTQVMECGLP